MATLRLTISGVSGTRSMNDAKAQALANLIYNYAVLPNWPADKPLPATAADRLQAVVDWLGGDLVRTAQDFRRRELALQHAEADAADIASLST